jgi:AcrR family transcriptional regulator
MNKPGGRGRRPGRPETKALIREAARRRFETDGYQAVTMRSIAADAGVDVALVAYYFGSKRGLFRDALALPVDPIELLEGILAGELDSIAAGVLQMVLQVWDGPTTGPPLRAAASAAVADPTIGQLVREAVGEEIVARLGSRLGPDGGGRAAAFAAQVSGVIFSRYLLAVEPIASLPAEEVVRLLEPALRRTLAGE